MQSLILSSTHLISSHKVQPSQNEFKKFQQVSRWLALSTRALITKLTFILIIFMVPLVLGTRTSTSTISFSRAVIIILSRSWAIPSSTWRTDAPLSGALAIGTFFSHWWRRALCFHRASLFRCWAALPSLGWRAWTILPWLGAPTVASWSLDLVDLFSLWWRGSWLTIAATSAITSTRRTWTRTWAWLWPSRRPWVAASTEFFRTIWAFSFYMTSFSTSITLVLPIPSFAISSPVTFKTTVEAATWPRSGSFAKILTRTAWSTWHLGNNHYPISESTHMYHRKQSSTIYSFT